MGLTYVPAVVLGPKGRSAIKFLVDSGASLTVLPHPVWRRLGLKANREMVFTLADGTEVKRKISECRIQILEFKSHTPVVLGEPTDAALLGAITLEILGLKLNPFTRRLEPLHMMLAAAGSGATD